MSKAIPTIFKYMSTDPVTIRSDATLADAHKILREQHIRHLPVLEGGQLVGMMSERDMRFIESFKDVDPRKVQVSDAMTQDVYTTTPDAPLNQVAAEMAESKHGSAVVMQNGKVVGIFTAVDGLRALAELLETRLAK